MENLIIDLDFKRDFFINYIGNCTKKVNFISVFTLIINKTCSVAVAVEDEVEEALEAVVVVVEVVAIGNLRYTKQ